jgi:methylamine dehydrogenase accessory protein MauD
MTEALIASNAILWLLVIVLALTVLALARQVGVLHERVAPAGALSPTNGPKPGERVAEQDTRDINGVPVTVGGAAERPTLLLWISPTCPVCKALVPTAMALARDERLRLLFASDGAGVERHRQFILGLGIGDYPYLLSEPLGRRFEVSRLPFAALIAADGTLAGKGLVNTREHLESLVESMETGIHTLQDYLQQGQALPESENARASLQKQRESA